MQRLTQLLLGYRLVRGPSRASALLGALLLLALFTVPYARAATLRTVTTLADTVNANDGLLSLREAISFSAPGDAIDFAVTGRIFLNGGELVIGRALTITGPGARKLTLTGNDTNRIFNVQGTDAVTISGLTLTHGRAPVTPDGTDFYGDCQGGAILNEALLTLNGCAITVSSAIAHGGTARKFGGTAQGGGIYNSGSLTLRDCQLSGNQAVGGLGAEFSGNGHGGGILSFGPTTLINSTISDNVCRSTGHQGQGFGGGMSLLYSQVEGWTQILVGCTVVRNVAASEQDLSGGGGIDTVKSQVILRDTLVAYNVGDGHPSDVYAGEASQGYNLVGALEFTGGSWQSTDLTGTPSAPLDPQVGPLQNNGGPTDTCSLHPGSAAIDAGDDTIQNAPDGITADQRGLARRIGPHVDIGAYERGVPQPGPSFVVNTLDDSGDEIAGVEHCSLREAIQAADGQNDSNTVTFKAGLTGTLLLSTSLGTLAITNPTTISGPGARVVSVSGGNALRVFDVSGSGVSIGGLTIRDGADIGFAADAGGTGGDGQGGGIRNAGSLTLTNCTLLLNRASGGSAVGQDMPTNGGKGLGGGIYNTGALSLGNCTLSRNEAHGGDAFTGTPNTGGNGLGGGIYSAGTLALTNCTVSGNFATGGFGVFGSQATGAGVCNVATATLASCTVAGNRANGSGAVAGGGLFNSGQFHLRNTLVALNFGAGSPDAASGFQSDGNNLIGTTDGSSGWVSSDKTGSGSPGLDPKLAALANNGGSMDTMALLAGSPAIDAASSAAPARDQRGTLRSGAPDIGAFEFGGISLVPPVNDRVTPSAGSSLPGAGRTFACRYLDSNGASDFQLVYFLVNSSLSQSSGLSCCYDAVANKLYLKNQAGNAWLGGFAPGTNQVISDPNGKGSLACAKTTVMRSNNLLEVDWVLTPNSGFAGNQKLYLYSQNKEGLTDGWDQLGAWNVASKPVDTSVSPSSGPSGVGTARTLTAVYSDQNGGDDLSTVSVLVNSRLAADGGLYGYYDGATNRLYLRNAANTAWLGGFTPGSANTISVANGTLKCVTTKVTKSATGLSITWSFAPNGTFIGTKNVYLSCQDKSGLADGWDLLGSWTITP